MKILEITGNKKLTGTIHIDGDKNSAVALIPAAILSDEKVTITNVPNISDTSALEEILNFLNAKVEKSTNVLIIDSSNIENKEIPVDVTKKLRASYYFMGALLGKYKKVEMYFPGGCNIGSRPIDQHLKGFEALGATITEEDNKYTIVADELVGANIKISMPGKGATTSVGATINIMLAAVRAKGTTVIENAAKEPQISNLATFLNSMGAQITGAGTETITIEGVDYLGTAHSEVIPDRIEAGTYLIAGALVGENLNIEGLVPEHCEALLDTLETIGVPMTIGENNVIINSEEVYRSTNIKTVVYPGFVTDLQQPITTLLTQCTGVSEVVETIYENRFQNVEFLIKMGAIIAVDDRVPYKMKAKVVGPSKLKGTDVTATDLRAGASLVLAALKAEGTTNIKDAEHILRGYANIVQKLQDVGANITIKEI
jgi:UDP-N-acetylglucosamine 1-carboxyvinyltransferase